jgi:hypothetical protein
MSRRWKWPGLGALTAALVMAAGPAFAAAGWTVVSVPRTPSNTELNGAFVRTASDAWAVGQQFGAAGQLPPPPVTYHFNGTRWSLVGTPDLGTSASLAAVSASGASEAWAVGFTGAGRFRQALFEHWNGSAWSVVPGPGGGLTGVVDLGPANAWAVGQRGVVDHWDGTSWTSVTVPFPNPSNTSGTNLTAITASSASDIWAVGGFTNASFTNSVYALHFNGTSWSVTILPQPSGSTSPALHAVAAIAPGNVWAAGENEGVPGQGLSTLIEHFDGTSWSIVPSPTPGAYPQLNGVAARSASDVYAVGFHLPSANGGVQQGLILRWNGSAWSADADPTAGTFSPLYAAATAPGAPEWAAGINSSDQALVLNHA